MTPDPAPRPSEAASRGSAMTALHGAVVLFGLAGLFGKWIDLPAATIVLGRTGIATLALLALLIVRGRDFGRFEWRLAVNGALLAAHWVAFFQAIQSATVAVALLGFAGFPLFVALFEALFLDRKLSTREWLLTATVCAGLLLIVPRLDLADHTVQGLLWGVFSGATFALLAVWNRALAGRRGASEIALWQNAIATLCLVPSVILAPSLPSARDIALLIVLGVACTALAHTLFIWSLRTVSAHTASVIACLEPVYGIVLAAALLHEIPDARMLAGGALIVGASLCESMTAAPPLPQA